MPQESEEAAVRATGDRTIGNGVVGSDAVTPTLEDGITPVYLLEINSASNSLTIDGKAYPINHGTDGKV